MGTAAEPALDIQEAPELLQLALLPSPAPSRGLACSLVFHVVLVVFLIFLPQILPPPAALAYPSSDVNLAYEPITFDGLPAVSDGGSGPGGGTAGGSPAAPGGAPSRAGSPKPAAKPAPPPASGSLPKMVYSGPQEIISNPPNPTNNVQTIRRPDLLSPPKLKFAVRLQSMVVMPAPRPSVSLAPREPAKTMPPATELAVVPVPTVENPVLPVRVPQKRRPAVEVRDAPKLAFRQQSAPVPDVRSHPLPVLSQDEGTGTKAALVVNAVNVPANSPKDVPDAELEGSFAVMPLRTLAAANLPSGVGAPGSGSGSGDRAGAGGSGTGEGGDGGNGHGTGGSPNGTGTGSGSGGTGTGTGGGHGSGAAASGTGTGAGGGGRGSGSGSGVGPGRGSGRGSGPGSGTGTGTGPGGGTGMGSGPGNGPGSGTGSGRFPGIIIVGGSSGRGGSFPSRTASPPPRRSYDITIISGGASSGASRDLGIFARRETVYTVYISMADSGGGPAYSMQYALAGDAPAGNGMMSPPFATKKIAATATEEQIKLWGAGGPVFITGIVDEHGRMQDLRAVYPQDPRSAAAVAPFSKWKFEAAEVNGKLVPAKVLIGVTLTPSHTDKAGN